MHGTRVAAGVWSAWLLCLGVAVAQPAKPATPAAKPAPANPRLEALKKDVAAKVKVDLEKVNTWIANGAQVSQTVGQLLKTLAK